MCSRLLRVFSSAGSARGDRSKGVKFTRATANFSCMLTIDVKFTTLQNAECCMGTLMGWSLREFTNQMSGEAKRYTKPTKIAEPADRRKIHDMLTIEVKFTTSRASAAPAVVVAILTLTYIFSFVHLLGKSFHTKYTRNMSRESARQMMRETMKGLRVAQSKL
jgi:hypothetical protein